MPPFPVKELPLEEKGPCPCDRPLRHGGLTGERLTQVEALAEPREHMMRSRKYRPGLHQLRRLPYKFRWAPRNRGESTHYAVVRASIDSTL